MSILDRPEDLRSNKGKSRLNKLGGLAVAILISFGAVSNAAAETRTLKLFFIHTKERAEITFKRNGRYDKKGLEQINRFLRDWRRNEPAQMDPKLLDLVWEVYQAVGARDYIHVVSAYRSPTTNASLRSRSSGVAENSQHMKGKAMDFYIPGVKLSTLRAAGFKAQVGGVGYYPKSGAPFVHLDTGNVRSWPRMSRQELMALFPDGRTLHLPADGKPLPGYQQALAEYKSRKKAPANIQLASTDTGSSRASAGSGNGLLSALFGGGNRNNNQEPAAAPARKPAPAAPVREAAPAPVATPAPQQETIIAALPERNAPVPGAAPRPMLDVGAKPAQPIVPGIAVGATAAAPEPQAEVGPVLANVPVPTRRPEYAPEVQVAAASDLPISAIAAERAPTGGSEAIAEMLAMSAADARAGVVVSNVPIPTRRPALDTDQVASVTQVAAASTDGDVFALAALPETRSAALGQPAVEIPPAPQPDERMAALSEKPRVAPIGRELDSGIRTTAKAPRPQPGSTKQNSQAKVVPLDQTLVRWAFRRDVDVNSAGGTTNGEAYNVVWSAPETVYTVGFQQNPDVNPNRFTGKAVTFMSVARFPTEKN